MTESLWQGPPCSMCNGTGIRPWPLHDPQTTVRCPDCNGHGREPSEPDQGAAP